MKSKLLVLLLLPATLLGYLLLWPTPVDPLAWKSEPARDLSHVPQRSLTAVALLSMQDQQAIGSEDVSVDASGFIYAGVNDGRILKYAADGRFAGELAQTAGRPLGHHFDPQGNLLVADADRGLLRISTDGSTELLSSSHAQLPYRFTDDVDVARDGKIYFSDASARYPRSAVKTEFLESRAHGRLLMFDPVTGQTSLLRDQLYFANGVALNAAQDALLFTETTRYRVMRLWLSGPRQGQLEVFANNLPGMPDGISRASDGGFWVAMVSPRSAILDGLADYPWLRKIIARVPNALLPEVKPFSMVLKLDAAGNPAYVLNDPASSRISHISSVEEAEGTLYLGSFSAGSIGVIRALPEFLAERVD
jgi:sugar lactone lactonase YvrE